jgi:hypothetical protein
VSPKRISDEYFTERDEGTQPRVERQLSDAVWAAIAALVTGRIRDGSLGGAFPDVCRDKSGQTIGVDESLFADAVVGDIPSLDWPLPKESPGAGPAMDLIEFIDRHVAEAERRSWHRFQEHHHLDFDTEAGQENWRLDVGRILRRNGLAFEIREDGRVRRLGDPVTRIRLSRLPATGDRQLDNMLSRASDLYFTPDEALHRDALIHLWRAFERLKSLLDPNKKTSAAAVLDLGADERTLRAILEEDGIGMTGAGNNLTIRHSEVGKAPIDREDQVDYLFGRLFNLVWLLLPLVAAELDN